MKGTTRLNLFLKSSKVGIFSTLADIISMFLLGLYTNISIKYQLYISSFIGLFISFFGQKLITFQNKSTGIETVKQMGLFLTWEILFIIIITQLVIYVTVPIDNALRHIPSEKIKDSSILSILFYVDTDKDGNEQVELHTLTNIAIKHFFILVLFTFVSLPIYNKIFKLK